MDIYDRVKYLCEKKGITVHVLEKEVGIARGLISKWRTNSPNIKNIIIIADYFDVSLDYLVLRTDVPHTVESLVIDNTKKSLHLKDLSNLYEEDKDLVYRITSAVLNRPYNQD